MNSPDDHDNPADSEGEALPLPARRRSTAWKPPALQLPPPPALPMPPKLPMPPLPAVVAQSAPEPEPPATVQAEQEADPTPPIVCAPSKGALGNERLWSARSEEEGNTPRQRKELVVTVPPASDDGLVTYRAGGQNNKPGVLRDLRVEHTLPTGAEFVSADPPATLEGDHLTWQFGDVARDGKVMMAVTVRPALDLTLPRATFFHFSTAGEAPPRPRLRLTVAAPARASKGKPVAFRLTVHNTGTAAANDIVVHGRFAPATQAQEAKIALLKPGQNETVVFTGCENEAETLTLTAEAQSSENCTATVTVPVTLTSPKLELHLAGSEQAEPGQAISYRLTVTNTGTASATATVVTCDLPAGLRLVLAEPEASLDHQQRQLRWELTSLESQHSRCLELQLAAERTCRETTANVAAQVRCEEGSEASARSLLRLVAPKIEMTLAGPDQVFTEGEVEFTLTLANTGTSASAPAKATVSVPNELTFQSANHDGSFDFTRHRVVWPLPALQPGESMSVKVRFHAALPATVRIEAGSDPISETRAEKSLHIAIDEQAAPNLLDRLLAEVDRELGARVARTAAPAPRAAVEEGDRYLLFDLGEITYAIPAASVLEVGRPPRVTAVPNVPDWLLGLTNVRGDITSVVDLCAFLGLEPINPTAQTRLLIVRADGKEMTTGLLVDGVKGIRRIPAAEFHASEAVSDDRIGPLVRGVAEYKGTLLVALDLEQMLLAQEMQQFEFA